MSSQSTNSEPQPNRRALIAVMVLAGLGLALSAELLRIHLTVVTDPFHPFSCRVNEAVDCNAVALSPQAVLLGVPVPIWGLLTYLLFGALALTALRVRRIPWSHAADFILLLALWSVGYSAYLAAVAAWVIKKFCLYCAGLYIINIGLFLAGMFAARPLSQFIRRRYADLHWLIASTAASVAAGVGAMLAFLLVVGLYYWSHQTRLLTVAPDIQMDVSRNAVMGSSRARVTIIEFSDFECPACREMQPIVKALLQKYPLTVRVISKSFPLDSTCNSELSKPIHPDGCIAAYAANCALRMGKYEEFTAQLWTATDLSRPNLLKIAEAQGLNPAEFNRCLDGPEAKEAILIDIEDAKKIKLEATPTFIVNGHKFEGKQTLPWCSRLIEKLLNHEPIPADKPLDDGEALTVNEMIGRSKTELDTPALLVDLDKLAANIRQMADFFRDKPAKTRPMWKTPKTVPIAKMQLEAGAIGITCAKVSEAEILVEAGVKDVLIANEVVGASKTARLAALIRRADVKCAVDDLGQVAALSQAAQEAGVTIGVVVDVFVGLPRCGVKPEDAPALAAKVNAAPGLRLRGVMGYEGHIVNLEDEAARKAGAHDSMGRLTRAADLIRAAGLPCDIVSGGGTGTYNFSGTFPGVTEVQVGSYCLMDTKYDKLHLGFEKAATILASVCSKSPALSGWTIIDAGMKVMSYEFGLPELIGVPGARLAMLSEEHGHLFAESGDPGLRLGDKVELYPSHICTTVNLHDRMFVIQNGKVVDVWPIAARGKSQ